MLRTVLVRDCYYRHDKPTSKATRAKRDVLTDVFTAKRDIISHFHAELSFSKQSKMLTRYIHKEMVANLQPAWASGLAYMHGRSQPWAQGRAAV